MAQKPDTVDAKDTGTNFIPHPEGQFAARCVDIIDLGVKPETYPGQDTREVQKTALVFASGELNEDGFLHVVWGEYTNSMHEKANLRRLLEQWRGKAYTDDEAKTGVPLHKLHNQPALIVVEHKTSQRGRTYARISSITPLPRQMEPPDVGEYTRSDYWEDRKREYAEAVIKHHAVVLGNGDEPPLDESQALEDEPNDLPF